MTADSKRLGFEAVVEAVKEIIDLHEKTESGVCGECYMPWPCRTVDIMKRKFEG